MSQVEVRARYVAQREFPDADILHPMWDIDHVERGVEALANYPIDEFHETFRDFYDALREPSAFVPRAYRVDEDTWQIHKSFTLTPDDRIEEVYDVAVIGDTHEGEPVEVGPIPQSYDNVITAAMPMMEFADDFDFETEFHEIVMAHLLAQIRDLYLHMGEEPPEEYFVEGIGKAEIFGDQYQTEWRGIEGAPHGGPDRPS